MIVCFMLTFQRLKTLGKVYLGTTAAYGFWHARKRRNYHPAHQVAIILAAPVGWPAYMGVDIAESMCDDTTDSRWLSLSDDS